MYRKDFLVRELERFGKVLAAVLGYKKAQDWEKFQKELNEAAASFTGLDLERVMAMNTADFESGILHSETLSLQQKKILAAILFEKLEYQITNPIGEVPTLATKCIVIYELILNSAEGYDLDAHYKLEILRKMVQGK